MKLLSIFKPESAEAVARRRADERQRSAPRGEAQGASRREQERPADRLLAVQTQAWLSELPPHIRPLNACKLYPRVVNRLALCWNDAALTARLFDDLLMDRRGSRRGFPAAVSAELLELRNFSSQRREEVKAHHWDEQSQATNDRR